MCSSVSFSYVLAGAQMAQINMPIIAGMKHGGGGTGKFIGVTVF